MKRTTGLLTKKGKVVKIEMIGMEAIEIEIYLIEMLIERDGQEKKRISHGAKLQEERKIGEIGELWEEMM
jgi:hypothetical protein